MRYINIYLINTVTYILIYMNYSEQTNRNKLKARERVYTQCTSPLPQLGEDQGAGNPNGKPFTAPHDSFTKRSLRRTPASASKEVSKIPPGDQVKVNSPEQIFQRAYPLQPKKEMNTSIVVDSKKKRFFEAVLMVVKDKVLVSVGDIKSA